MRHNRAEREVPKQRSYTSSETKNNDNNYNQLHHPSVGSERSSTTTTRPPQPRRRGLTNHDHRANAPGQPMTTTHDLRLPETGSRTTRPSADAILTYTLPQHQSLTTANDADDRHHLGTVWPPFRGEGR
jgi:hypothetical protein